MSLYRIIWRRLKASRVKASYKADVRNLSLAMLFNSSVNRIQSVVLFVGTVISARKNYFLKTVI